MESWEAALAKNYKGVETKNLITAQNCYYLSADGLNGDGANADALGITAKTADELKASGMVGLLGSSYILSDGQLSDPRMAGSGCRSIR